MKLVFESNGETVKLNEVYKDFRGEEWVVYSWSNSYHPGSTGRVYVYKPGKDMIETAREFFPSVMGMKIVEETK